MGPPTPFAQVNPKKSDKKEDKKKSQTPARPIPQVSKPASAPQLQPDTGNPDSSTSATKPSVFTCWLSPIFASEHIMAIRNEVDAVLERYGLNDTNCALYAGFDESLLLNGIGYLQQAHLFTTVDVFPSSPLVSALAIVLSPLPGMIYTQSTRIRLPVFKDDGTEWRLDDFLGYYFKRGLDGNIGVSEAEETTKEDKSIMKPEDDAGDGERRGKRSRAEKRNDKGKGKAGRGRKGKRRQSRGEGRGNHDDHQDSEDEDPNSDSSGPGDDPEKPAASNIDGPHGVTFNVESTIRCNNDSPLGIGDEQVINSSGSLTIQMTNQTTDSRTYEIDFTRVVYSPTRLALSNLFFEQSHLQITFDSGRKDAQLDYIRPQQTAVPAEVKKTSAAKTTTNVNAVLNLSASPSGTIGISRAWEKGHGQEHMQAVSRINNGERLGLVWWGYEVNDEMTRQAGLKMVKGDPRLPLVKLRYQLPLEDPATAECGNKDDDETDKRKSSRDAPIDVEFASFWTLDPRTVSSSASSTSSLSSSSKFLDIIRSVKQKRPSYSNMVQCIILTIPPVLHRDSLYVAEVTVDNISPDLQVGNGGLDAQVTNLGPAVSETTKRVVCEVGEVKFGTGTMPSADERTVNKYVTHNMLQPTMLTSEASSNADKSKTHLAKSPADTGSSGRKKRTVRVKFGNLGMYLSFEKKVTTSSPEKDVTMESGGM
ncbi:hypothetical protein D9613_001262 [Agrocybe pediades]|uniref:Uncharacterized protein n=1 Tax=Agrocybe pediades TaxID=84607 RepID=A0A8H4VS13_9AGAR|nr:hypothetical protein D9613_001262 [Agrocybe pediades]